MSILDAILDYLVKRTWAGRQFKKFYDYREKHFLFSLFCLPIDIVILTIMLVIPAIIVLILASWIGYPVKWFGGDDAEVLIFGLVIIGAGSVLVKRRIIQKRQKR